jgi:hypothetical protein
MSAKVRRTNGDMLQRERKMFEAGGFPPAFVVAECCARTVLAFSLTHIHKTTVARIIKFLTFQKSL